VSDYADPESNMSSEISLQSEEKLNRDPVISGHWLSLLLHQRASTGIDISLDLGITTTPAKIEHGRALLQGTCEINMERLASMKFKPEDCFLVRGTQLEKIYLFSENTHRYFKLYHPRPDWPPTIVINNAPMHVMSDCSPADDAARKYAALSSACRMKGLRGKAVLDTCFGLGYSALRAIKLGASSVVSCELSPEVLEIAGLNPWSQSLFTEKSFTVVGKDLRDHLPGIAPESFDIVFHDPPTITMAGELYSSDLYKSLFRVLKKGGCLYHYTGSPGGRNSLDLARRVAERLRNTGLYGLRRVWGGIAGRKA